MLEPDVCAHCPHVFYKHAMIAAVNDPSVALSGYRLCPEPGCPCYSTWSHEDTAPDIPEDERVSVMRTMLQSGEL